MKPAIIGFWRSGATVKQINKVYPALPEVYIEYIIEDYKKILKGA